MGIVAITQMAAGDGMADIIGRYCVLLVSTSVKNHSVVTKAVNSDYSTHGMIRLFGFYRQFGKRKWPFAPSKSLLGSLAFVLSGFFVSCALLALMNHTSKTFLFVINLAIT